jgi:hypothetical protein
MTSVRELVRRLEEATYARDAEARAQAVGFAKRLEAFFRSSARTGGAGDPVIVQDYGDSLAVEAEAVMPGLKHLFVRLIQEGRVKDVRGAASEMWKGKYMLWVAVLPEGFSYPEDAAKVADAVRENRETLVHEFVHVQDFMRGAPPRAKKIAPGQQKDLKKYFNSPTEWNAFFQQGVLALERDLEFMRANFPERYDTYKAMGQYGSPRELLKAADSYWRSDFLERMDAATRRRFEKRVAELWQGMYERGIVGKAS